MHNAIKALIALVFLVYNAVFISMFPDNPEIQRVLFGFTVCAGIGAVMLISMEEKSKKVSKYGNCVVCGKSLLKEEYEIDTGNLCEECRKETINRE
jgi:hypothetical protein